MRFIVPGAASRASEAPPIATMTALPGNDSSSTMVSRRTSHMPCMRQNSLTTGVIKFQEIVPAASLCAALMLQGNMEQINHHADFRMQWASCVPICQVGL